MKKLLHSMTIVGLFVQAASMSADIKADVSQLLQTGAQQVGAQQALCNKISAQQGPGGLLSPTLRSTTSTTAADFVDLAAKAAQELGLTQLSFAGNDNIKCSLRKTVCALCSSSPESLDGAFLVGSNKNYMCDPQVACARSGK